MHRAIVCALTTAIASSDIAYADAPVTQPSSSRPPWFIGGRVGVAALTRNGATHFDGTGSTYAFELGFRLRSDFEALIAVDVGPRLKRDVSTREEGPFSKRPIFATALVEYRPSWFSYGAGGGLVHEMTDRVVLDFDHSSTVTGQTVISDAANGAIAVVRVGATVDNSLLPIVIVAQGYAMWFPRDAEASTERTHLETGYMATLGIGFRYPP